MQSLGGLEYLDPQILKPLSKGHGSPGVEVTGPMWVCGATLKALNQHFISPTDFKTSLGRLYPTPQHSFRHHVTSER